MTPSLCREWVKAMALSWANADHGSRVLATPALTSTNKHGVTGVIPVRGAPERARTTPDLTQELGDAAAEITWCDGVVVVVCGGVSNRVQGCGHRAFGCLHDCSGLLDDVGCCLRGELG